MPQETLFIPKRGGHSAANATGADSLRVSDLGRETIEIKNGDPNSKHSHSVFGWRNTYNSDKSHGSYAPSGFVRTISTNKSGQAFVSRQSESKRPSAGTGKSANRADLSNEPVHRLSMLHEGACFEIDGIHYENQYNDIVLDNQNFNGPLMPGVDDEELEEGGEWMTAVEKDGEWIWIPSKDVETPENICPKNNKETGKVKKWKSNLLNCFRRPKS